MSLFQLKNKLHLIANKSDKNIVTTEQINASNEVTKSKTESNINNNKKKFPLNKTLNKINSHILINSEKKTKKNIPNLIKNVHHRPKIAKSSDNFGFQPITSLEQKLSKQLSRISDKYTEIKNRRFFNNKGGDTNFFWQNFPDYEIYRQLKVLEMRKEVPFGFTRPKLKPLINSKRDKLGKLAKNLYDADQVERFKNLLYKYKVNTSK